MKKLWMSLAAVAVLVPAMAGAQSMAGDEIDFQLRGGAGVMSFAGEAAALTEPGAAYNVSVSADFNRWIGAEVGYLGGVYNSEELLSTDRSTLFENGGQALVKIGPEVRGFTPYATGGLALTRINVLDEDAQPGLFNDATQVRFPVGLGVDYEVPLAGGDLLIGARGIYSFGTDSDAFPTLPDASANSTWMGLANIGGSF